MQRAQAQRELLEEREALSRALLEMELARGEQEALAEALGKVGTRTRPTAGSGMDMGASPWVYPQEYQSCRGGSPLPQLSPCPGSTGVPHIPQMSPSAPQVSPDAPGTPQAPVPPIPLCPGAQCQLASGEPQVPALHVPLP